MFVDLVRQGNYNPHHEYNTVRNDIFPSHHSSHLGHHRHHPYSMATSEQTSQQHRYSSQANTVLQYHHHSQPGSVVNDSTAMNFDAESCARDIITSPLSSTGSSTTAANAVNSEEHHSTGLPPMTPTSADSQP